MKGLITADWQVEWENLDLCNRAWIKALRVCAEHKLNWIFVTGDAKHKYNPIDARVIKWWQAAIALAIRKKVGVYFLLGNHDRDGLYTDSHNWFPILRKAGGICIDRPEVMDMGSGKLMLLPFMSNVKKFRKAAKHLSKQADPEKDILLFHANLKDCRYNKTGERSDAKLLPSDLFPRRYKYVIGGDIHFPQKVQENIYYVGSPFATDWGEANQRKRFLAIIRNKVLSVDTEMPNWYDEQWEGFPPNGRKDWNEARIRIHIKCRASSEFGRDVEEARRAAERKYPGATIFVVPEFDSGGDTRTESFEIGDRDERKIAKYVEETVPSNVKEKQAISYLNYQIRKVSERRRMGSYIYFQKAVAKNFLCFKKLEFDFRKEGLTVIQGVNGAGKTSLVQPIPVALFGKTFKGQKYDAWARRGTNSRSAVQVWFKDSRGRKVSVKRGRRPVCLRLAINGVDESSGNKHTDKGATQELIEQVSGFTWETLANSVYIDQTITRAFLSGRDKARSDVLSRFQNLERFERALKLVRCDASNVRVKIAEVSGDFANVRERISECREEIKEEERKGQKLSSDLNRKFRAAEKEWIKAKKELKEQSEKSERRREVLRKKVDIINRKVSIRLAQYTELKTKKDALVHRIQRIKGLKETCPTCLQPVRIIRLREMRKGWGKQIQELSKAASLVLPKIRELENKSTYLEAKYDSLALATQQLTFKVKEKESKADFLHSQIRENKGNNDTVRRLKKKLVDLRVRRAIFQGYLEDLRKNRMPLLEYAEKAFSRDGIPAFLNAQLSPVLNKAADYYARLFTDKAIQIRFDVIDGDLEPIVLNAEGGENIEDQSTGEKAMAGLVTSFALREIAPATNILILDEPGEGLDEKNARKFAQAIKKLKRKFKTILLTTHNQNILQELASERIITVVKKGNVRLIQ